MEEQRKFKTCNRIYIDISFFTDVYSDNKIKEYFYIKYLPGSKDIYMDDAFHQGGFVKNHCFKVTNRDTLDDVKTLMLELYHEAKKDDIDLAITRDGFDVRCMLTNSSVQFSGMVFMRSNGYVSRNRRINDEEINEIFQYLLQNIHPDDDYEKVIPKVEETWEPMKYTTTKEFFEKDNGLDLPFSVKKNGEYTSVCSIERAEEYAKQKVDEALELVKSGATLLEDGHDVGTELILSAYDSSPNERYVSINVDSVDKIKEHIKY